MYALRVEGSLTVLIDDFEYEAATPVLPEILYRELIHVCDEDDHRLPECDDHYASTSFRSVKLEEQLGQSCFAPSHFAPLESGTNRRGANLVLDKSSLLESAAESIDRVKGRENHGLLWIDSYKS